MVGRSDNCRDQASPTVATCDGGFGAVLRLFRRVFGAWSGGRIIVVTRSVLQLIPVMVASELSCVCFVGCSVHGRAVGSLS